MSKIPDNVRQALLQLVPASIINEITCYAFYDNHPRDDKNIDITVCTKLGDIREYFQRDLLSSVNLDSRFELKEIRILRNKKCELFYLVAGGDELTILSRREELQVHCKLNSVLRYDITDSSCNGQALLKVTFMDSNIPVVPDDDFKNFKCLDFSPPLDSPAEIDSRSIITHLKRKLMEAKYTVKCNEKTYRDFLDIRQAVAFSIYKKIHPNLQTSVFKDGLEMLAETLNIHIKKPWIKTCNNKIVIVYNVCNKNKESLEDVHILLHGTAKKAIVYTTKIFEKTDSSPFWKESRSMILKYNAESALVLVIEIGEMKYNVISKIEINGVIICLKSDIECVLPIDTMTLSSLDVMAEDFDVLSSDPMDNNIILALLASTEKTDLILRKINSESSLDISSGNDLTIDVFCKYLKMERVQNAENIAIYRRSPYHVLNGVMIVSCVERQERDQLVVTVHSRSSAQVLSLIHHIHDAVPCPIVVTTPTHKIAAKKDSLSVGNETTSENIEPVYNYNNYAASMINRTGLVLEYLDKSMIQMNESKNPVVRNKVGSGIDLFAQGETEYKEFKDKMRAEAALGVKMLNDNIETISISDEMCLD